MALAASMIESQQLLCSSCQGLYIDTADMGIVHDYARRMLRALDACAKDYNPDMGIHAQVGLAAYTEYLESQYKQQHVYRGERCVDIHGWLVDKGV